MLVNALYTVFKWLVYSVLEKILKWTYLSLPLWFHMLILQLRDEVDTLPSINGYLHEDSTWTMVYDGVALVNSHPGKLKAQLNSIKVWFQKTVGWWITLAVLIVVLSIVLITIKYVF